MPPFPGMPYGPAPAWSFAIFEFGLYLLFILCFWHAYKRGRPAVAYLLGGLVFGLLLEFLEVLMGSYTYGRFWLMLGKAPADVPLCVGIAWSIIMYTARLLSDSLGLPLWAAAAFDTLLALNIDFSIDVVAYRMHMWNWDWSHTTANPLTAQWFGIPWGNFFGWQTVVFCYSAFSRLLERRLVRLRAGVGMSLGIALLAIVCSLGVLYATEMAFPTLIRWGILGIHRFLAMCFLLIALFVRGWRFRKASAEPVPGLSWIVPGWFHLLFAGCFFILGFYKENIWMTTAGIINLSVGLLLHVVPIIRLPNKQERIQKLSIDID